MYDSSGNFLYKIGEPGSGDGQFNFPWGLCVEKRGNHNNLFVCNYMNDRIDQFTVEGCFTGKTVAQLQRPAAITTTPDGRILVSSFTTNKIHVLK